ncbi:putative histone deacetylase [Helianthus annuus]|nr:putative histone deacetylase [Helianthus annuus]KAJ0883277.1 putative histone deacetylase [Helianthus annuus]
MSDHQQKPQSHHSPPATSGHINVFWDDGMLDHYTGEGVFDSGIKPGFLEVLKKHLENSDRDQNMLSILKRGPISPFLSWLSSSAATVTEILSFHTQALVRPPGHHAQLTQADGYCFLDNAGLAVQYALDSGCKRVAVIDIDVHYGNGTAEGFYRSDKVLTGGINELGEGAGFGFNLNVPLPNATGDIGYKCAMTEVVVPAVRKFDPNMMVFVVGQDSSAVSMSSFLNFYE